MSEKKSICAPEILKSLKTFVSFAPITPLKLNLTDLIILLFLSKKLNVPSNSSNEFSLRLISVNLLTIIVLVVVLSTT